MERRTFLKGTAIGVGTFAAGLGIEGRRGRLTAAREMGPASSLTETIGRPVRVVSIGFTQGHPLEEIAELVDKEGANGADIIALPETWRGQDERSEETLEGPTVKTMGRLAKKNRVYIVCPIDRREGERRFNSAVLLDRDGEVACVYNKIYPVWQEECLKKPPVYPGEEVRVHQTDFGGVGFAICFDVNWAAIWERLSNRGAELVIWPSA